MSTNWYKVCKSTIDAQMATLNQRTEDAERKAAAGEEFCRILSNERDALLAERDKLLETLRESAATLTKVDTQGMETNEILKKVRAEKEEVEMGRPCGAESRRPLDTKGTVVVSSWRAQGSRAP